MKSHVKQKDGLGTCGAVAYAAILGLSELQGIRECKTKMRGQGAGTHYWDVREAFRNRGISTHAVDVDHLKISQLFWLASLSSHFPIYASTSNRKRGTQHAIAIMDGEVYDGHYDRPILISAYPDTFIEDILVVDMELPTYGINHEILSHRTQGN